MDKIPIAEVLAHLREAVSQLESRLNPALEYWQREREAGLARWLLPESAAPLPAVRLVEFDPLPAPRLIAACTRLEPAGLPNDSPLVPWRTVYPVTPWPLRVAAAEYHRQFSWTDLPGANRAAAAIRLVVETIPGLSDGPASNWENLDRLSFHLDGPAELTNALYRALTWDALGVLARPASSGQATLVSLRPLGLEPEQAVYPVPANLPAGSLCLIELMLFPEKFLFFEISGLAPACARVGSKLEILVLLGAASEILAPVSAANFRLRCTPVVNLFERSLPPLELEPAHREHRVTSDDRSRRESAIHSIDAVEEWDVEANLWRELPQGPDLATGAVSWQFYHRPRAADFGTDVNLVLPASAWQPQAPAFRSLKLRATCTSGELAIAEPTGRRLESAAGDAQARLLSAGAPPVRPARPNLMRWLTSGHAEAFAAGAGGQETFRRLLRDQTFLDGDVPRAALPAEEGRRRRVLALLEGIRLVEIAGDVWERPGDSRQPGGICQGRKITVEFDEDRFPGRDVCLVTAVLDRFLQTITPLGQFTRLVVQTRRQGEVYRCPPRFGPRTSL